MKFTEGAFRDWGYELAQGRVRRTARVTEDARCRRRQARRRARLLIKDRIADSMFQQVLPRPDEYDVLATPNLNGDYLSGRLRGAGGRAWAWRRAPTSATSYACLRGDARHGAQVRRPGRDQPGSSLILSGVMMFDASGWNEVADADRGRASRRPSQQKKRHLRPRAPDGGRTGSAHLPVFADRIVEAPRIERDRDRRRAGGGGDAAPLADGRAEAGEEPPGAPRRARCACGGAAGAALAPPGSSPARATRIRARAHQWRRRAAQWHWSAGKARRCGRELCAAACRRGGAPGVWSTGALAFAVPVGSGHRHPGGPRPGGRGGRRRQGALELRRVPVTARDRLRMAKSRRCGAAWDIPRTAIAAGHMLAPAPFLRRTSVRRRISPPSRWGDVRLRGHGAP